MAFNVFIPLQKSNELNSELVGVASTLSRDRDDEKMSINALKDMVTGIKSLGVNLFGNHEHSWENTLGYIKDAELNGKQVDIKISLDDAETNPKIPMLLKKLEKGINLGLSVGGNVTKVKYDYDKVLGKKIKVIDGVDLLEISVVGIPSNADSSLSLTNAIMKSFEKKCPLCNSMMFKGECQLCLYDTKKQVQERLRPRQRAIPGKEDKIVNTSNTIIPERNGEDPYVSGKCPLSGKGNNNQGGKNKW